MLFAILFTALLALGPAAKGSAGAGAAGGPRAGSRPERRLPVPAKSATEAPKGSVDPCKIYGAVYLETDPARRSGCFAIVYVEPDPAFADLLVFTEDNKLFADKAGLWAEAPNRDFADYALFVTPTRGLADFTIHYTNVRALAGCRTQ